MNILKQPKWVQKIISDKDNEIIKIKKQLHEAEKANEITSKMDWFTIGFHTTEKRKLYLIDKDHPHCIATIGAGCVMLFGVPKER